jgi:hypothetical protein
MNRDSSAPQGGPNDMKLGQDGRANNSMPSQQPKQNQ